MDRKEKRSLIGQFMDITNNRFNESELDTLVDIVTKRKEYNGNTNTVHNSFTDKSSEGKYTRNEQTKYTFFGDDDNVRIDVDYEYHDDDGDRDKSHYSYTTGRDILNNLSNIFKK